MRFLTTPRRGLHFASTVLLLAILLSTIPFLALQRQFGASHHEEYNLYALTAVDVPTKQQEQTNRNEVNKKDEVTLSPNSITWKDGCIDWPPKALSATKPKSVSGLAVTLLLCEPQSTVHQRFYLEKVCRDFVPSQLSHFLEPHGIDQLFVISGSKFMYKSIVQCLDLAKHDKVETWTNVDGTSLTTYRHRSPNNRTFIYFADNYQMKLPSYLEGNNSLFSSANIEPRFCSAPLNYISGTRWYSNEMLHFGILQNYDYWVKLDIDILFLRTFPIHLLQDMYRKGAVFSHTAEYGEAGSQTCTRGSRRAVQAFINSTAVFPWKREMCSQGYTTLQRDTDQYYTNLVVGSTAFWQSPAVLRFARYLSEYNPGFYRYRWTDQMFFHNAMGLFLDSYKEHVLDYTFLRCAPQANCWISSLDVNKFGPQSHLQCNNSGYFVHVKAASKLSGVWRQTVTNVVLDQSSSELYNHTYQHQCTYNLDYDEYHYLQSPILDKSKDLIWYFVFHNIRTVVLKSPVCAGHVAIKRERSKLSIDTLCLNRKFQTHHLPRLLCHDSHSTLCHLIATPDSRLIWNFGDHHVPKAPNHFIWRIICQGVQDCAILLKIEISVIHSLQNSSVGYLQKGRG